MRPLTQRAMEPTKASFATTQWDQEVESATAPDGHVRVHQSQAAPFSVGLPSGLARSQQLYMMQRFLNIPATPSYVAKDDGLVLDRVVVNVGGRSWWQTLTLRLRAQRAWNTQEFSKGKPHQVLGDPSMYALGGRFRVGFGAHTVLRGLGELGSLSGAVEDFRRFKRTLSRFGGGDDADADASRAANVHSSERKDTSHGDDTFRGRVTLQTKAFAGHLVSFDASLRERYQTPRKYIDGPSFFSASITSRGPRWFNYRLGVRQWLEDTLPAFEMSDVNLVLRPPPRREATAGCSVEHQATLWRGKRRAAPKGSKTKRPGGYAALPQTPCVVVGGLLGATARLALADNSVSENDGAPSTSVPPSLRSGDVDYRHCLSLTAHASVGSFARPLLDYTAVDLRYDLGSTSGVSSGGTSSGTNQNPAPVPDARDAPKTMMERMVRAGFDGLARVENETVTAGVTQQILGPVRLRAELRFSPGTAGRAYRKGWQALTRDDKAQEKEKEKKKREKEDPSLPPRAPRGKPPPRPGTPYAAGSAGSSMGKHSVGAGRFGDAWRVARKEMSGAELVYGIDCPLPPALGAARLVAWYNVNRGEAQAEMRLFDL